MHCFTFNPITPQILLPGQIFFLSSGPHIQLSCRIFTWKFQSTSDSTYPKLNSGPSIFISSTYQSFLLWIELISSLHWHIAWSEPILPHLYGKWESWVRWSLTISLLWPCAAAPLRSFFFIHLFLISSLIVYHNLWTHPQPRSKSPCRSLSLFRQYWTQQEQPQGWILSLTLIPSFLTILFPERWKGRKRNKKLPFGQKEWNGQGYIIYKPKEQFPLTLKNV